jgi:thiol-disulfide isomerase/thioredoxin
MDRGMRVKWAIAAVSALGLAFLTLNSSEVFNFSAHASGGVCPANAKPAKLNFTLKDFTGKTVKLSDYKGKVILLDFWATWCPPCKAEIPGFVELQEAYRDKGLQVVGVSVDDTPDKLKPFA